MEDSLQRTVQAIKTWPELKQLEENARARGRLTPEIQSALRGRSTQIAIPYIQERTGLDLSRLSPAEAKIVEAVGEYVGILREQGKVPNRTLEQLRNRSLRGAAEIAVAKSRPTQGYRVLADANLEDLSYEQIVVDHPQEFSARALWHSRRTLGLPNRWPEAPTAPDGKTQQHTERFLAWLADRAAAGDGLIAPFSDEERYAALGFDAASGGRVAGAAQSRIDFACYELGLPPLGLTAATPYEAWADSAGGWSFPVAGMTIAARERRWSPGDFDRIRDVTRGAPASNKTIWKTVLSDEDQRLQDWARQFEPAPWVRDELLLAGAFCMRHMFAIPYAHSDEIKALASALTRAREAIAAQPEVERKPLVAHEKVVALRALLLSHLKGEEPPPSLAGSAEAALIQEFGKDRARLIEIGAAIEEALDSPPPTVAEATPGDEEDEQDDEDESEEELSAVEGKLLTKQHRYRERAAGLALAKKEQALKETGKIACEACDLDSERTYGKAGVGVEAHHTEPLHALKAPKETRLSDLALLCATCHRVLHAHKPWLTVPQLRELVQGRRDN